MITLILLLNIIEIFNGVNAFSYTKNVQTICGAFGDGIHDDTKAVQKCFDLLDDNVGFIYFPSGQYLLNDTISVRYRGALTIAGDGFSSVLLWAFDDDLFLWDSHQEVASLVVKDINVISSITNKTNNRAAFRFRDNLVKSILSHIQLIGENGINVGSGIVSEELTDTVSIEGSFFWNIRGTGVQIGYGSEVRILGGRIIGDNRFPGSIGVHVTGNNGGVHIDSTDIIALDIGVLIDDSSGHGSNREIFITQATMDSCNKAGLAIGDSSYVSISGCWAASSNINQIWLYDIRTDPVVVIVGGTVFNGGAIGGNCSNDECNGITALSGRLTLNGLQIRNNKGKGVWIANPSVYDYVINGCTIFQNGQGVILQGTNYVFSGNLCDSNEKPNSINGTGINQLNFKC